MSRKVMRVVASVVVVACVVTSFHVHNCSNHYFTETCRDINVHHECKCDAACAHYGDCCVDAGPYNHVESEQYECVSVNVGFVYMKSSCPVDWEDERVARMCRDGSPLTISNSTDPLAHLPVYSTTTARTYTNHYCATCNNDARALTIWKLHMDCHFLKFDRLDAVSLTEALNTVSLVNGTWGVFSKSSGDTTFHECTMTPRWPRGVWVRHCTPAVAECSPDWAREDTSRRCLSYIDPVFSQGKKYKNIDCAICNKLNSEDVYCDQPEISIPVPDSSYPASTVIPVSPSVIPTSTTFPPPVRPTVRKASPVTNKTQQKTLTTDKPQEIPSRNIPDHDAPPATMPHKLYPILRSEILDQSLPLPIYRQYTPTTATSTPLSWFSGNQAQFPVKDSYDYDYDYEKERDVFHGHSFSIIMDFGDVCGGDVVGWTSECQLQTMRNLNMCRDVMCQGRTCEYVFRRCEASKYKITRNSVEISDIVDQLTGVSDTKQDKLNTDHNITANANPILFSRLNSTKCLKVMLQEKEYEMEDDGVVSVGEYRWEKSEYEAMEGGVLLCWPRPLSEKFSPVMGWMSRAGLSLSIVCIVLHLTAFILTPYLRNLPGKCRASLSLSLLGAYISFLVGSATRQHTTLCFVVAITMHYSFLASLCWMKVMAFDVWWSLRLARKELRVSGRGQNRRFIIYSVYSWLLAAVPSVIVLVLDITTPNGLPPNLLPSMGQYWCWFGQRRALLVFFGVPTFVIMTLNVALFVATTCEITITQESGRLAATTHHKRQLQLYLRLAVLMGFTWISGFVAGYLQMEAAWYIFVLLNTLHGVFTFLAFTCRVKVWRTIVGTWRGGEKSSRPVPTPARPAPHISNKTSIIQLSTSTLTSTMESHSTHL